MWEYLRWSKVITLTVRVKDLKGKKREKKNRYHSNLCTTAEKHGCDEPMARKGKSSVKVSRLSLSEAFIAHYSTTLLSSSAAGCDITFQTAEE